VARVPGLVGFAGKPLPLVGTSIVLGRGDDVDLRTPDVSVARRQARIDIVDDKVYLTAVSEGVATFVNDRRIKTVQLSAGDRITFGSTMFTYQEG
jgi:pSer/pThr/pTyr-binding forkhead associated (FHA) protein